MNIRRTFQGAYEISAVIKDEFEDEFLYTKQYFGYSRKEAIALFRQDIKDQNELNALEAEVRRDQASKEY